jgi:hypothetical protein
MLKELRSALKVILAAGGYRGEVTFDSAEETVKIASIRLLLNKI